MRKICVLLGVILSIAGIASADVPAVGDGSIVRIGPVKTWPAGPYSQVATNSGILTTTIPIVSLKGKGLTSLDLSLEHRSVNGGNDLLVYAAGKGWSHSGINFISNNNGIVRYQANRARDSWKVNFQNNTFDRNPGTRDDISQIAGGFKVIDYASKCVYYYDRGSTVTPNWFYLSHMVDPFGNQVTYSYAAGTDNLTRITDASGRYIEFTFDSTYTARVNRIHLQAGSSVREWDLNYVNQSGGANSGITYLNYLDYIQFPVPNSSYSVRPTVEFDQDLAGNITYLRTLSGKLWKFSYANTGPMGYNRVTNVFQPSTVAPFTTCDENVNHSTRFAYSLLYGNGGSTDEFLCNITDPLGFVYQHAYWNYFGVQGQSTTDFPMPIKRVQDPACNRYLDKWTSNNITSWNWWETYHWDTSSGVCDSFSDKEGRTTAFVYDSGKRGNLVSKSIVVSGVTCTDSFEYNGDGKLAKHTDPQGDIKTFEYDPTTFALKKQIVDPSGKNIISQYSYNGSGELQEEWVGNDPHTLYGNFDAYGDPGYVDPPSADATTFTYDDFGNKLSETKPNPGGTTNFTYDNWNRLVRTTFPDGAYVESTLDLDGNVTKSRLEDGTFRYQTFGNLGQPLITTVPVDGSSANDLVTKLEYDILGRKTALVAPDGLRTTFEYNSRGDLVKTTYQDATTRECGHDGVGNVLWRQNGRGQVVKQTYDELNRMTSVKYKPGTSKVAVDVTYVYRKDGLLSSRTDAFGQSIWTYNTAKQLTDYQDAATGKTLSYTYESGTGKPTSLAAKPSLNGSATNTWNYYYDPTTTRPLYTTQSLTAEIVRNSLYNADGSINKQTFGNGTKSEFGYDSRGRVTSIRHAKGSDNSMQELIGYQYENGNTKQYSLSVSGGPSYVTTYAHDLANRLTSEIRTDSTNQNPFSIKYYYTKGNDRLSTNRNGVISNYTYQSNMNLLASGEGFIIDKFGFDADGNPTKVTCPDKSVWVFKYDEESRVVLASKTNARGTAITSATYRYNGEGLRVEKKIGSGIAERYLMNGDQMVLATSAPSNTNQNITTYFSPGVGYYKSGQMFFYQANALGSNIAVRDAAGNLQSLTEYDAYGVERPISGTQKSQFRFAGGQGYQQDDETGLDLLGRRFYIPILGRFLNQDPIGLRGGLNLYCYCHNDPLSKSDPSGTQGVGHHLVPVSLWINKVSPDVAKFFNSLTSGPLSADVIHNYNGPHREYNAAVREAMNSFLESKNYREIGELTVEDAKEFVGGLSQFRDPRFVSYLNYLGKAIDETPWSRSFGYITLFIGGSDALMKGLREVILYRKRVQSHIDYAFNPDSDWLEKVTKRHEGGGK